MKACEIFDQNRFYKVQICNYTRWLDKEKDTAKSSAVLKFIIKSFEKLGMLLCWLNTFQVPKWKARFPVSYTMTLPILIFHFEVCPKKKQNEIKKEKKVNRIHCDLSYQSFSTN